MLPFINPSGRIEMDNVLNALATLFGVDPSTFLLIVGLVVCVCNLAGRYIPDDATGTLGVVRKIAKVLGLYLSNRVSSGVSVNDTARAVAGASAITVKSPGSPPITSKVSLRSPAFVAILAGIATLFLSGCAPAAVAGVNTAATAVCAAAPLAQALYDSAVATGDTDKVNRVLNQLQAACPSVLLLIHTVPVRVEVPVAVAGPERG
jgi:hypothetical protein